jgi:hypothetical protein
MLPAEVVVSLLAAHFIGDFLMQSSEVAKGKSRSNLLLLEHVTLYAVPLAATAGLLLASPAAAFAFLVLNLSLHFVTDFVTSRVSHRLSSTGRTHEFFCMLGLDQLIHLTTLVLTLEFFL